MHTGLEEDDTGPPQEQQTQEEPTPKTEELVVEVKEEAVLPTQKEATQPKVPAQETDVDMPRQNSVADERPSSGERSSRMSGIETPRESDVSPNALVGMRQSLHTSGRLIFQQHLSQSHKETVYTECTHSFLLLKYNSHPCSSIPRNNMKEHTFKVKTFFLKTDREINH